MHYIVNIIDSSKVLENWNKIIFHCFININEEITYVFVSDPDTSVALTISFHFTDYSSSTEIERRECSITLPLQDSYLGLITLLLLYAQSKLIKIVTFQLPPGRFYER